ncbi:HD domain-containing phosphohydrolase [Bdellovibrionota bacterium FG-1]
MADQFVSWGLDDILVGEPLPGTIYIYIDFRFITYRAQEDTIDRSAFERLELKKVRSLFIQEKDRPGFENWVKQRKQEKAPPLSAENQQFAVVRQEVHEKTIGIFQAQHPDKIVAQTIDASKKLVDEVMKFPYAMQTMAQLQTYSRTVVDHSVNVSVLSTYLAMQMGYSHKIILQHIGMGGLLHDIGKTKIKIDDVDDQVGADEKMKAHPELGLKIFENDPKIPNEVKMIIGQHHEGYDGTGYPKGLRGSQTYDLARIVAIANVFDGLVANGKGPMIERQKNAIHQLDQVDYRKFDPQKLEKILKILKMGV